MSEEIFKNFSGWVKKDAPLSALAAYKIGGRAKFVLTPKRLDDVEEALRISKAEGLPLFVMGSGTNLLVSDEGFDGIILYFGPHEKLNRSSLVVVKESDDEVLLYAPANYSKANLLDFALQKKWAGLEFSAGIPGTLGGGIFMNAGTKWGSYADVVSEVEFFSPGRGRYKLSARDIGFKYRGHGEGLFKDGSVVLSVTVKLKKNLEWPRVMSTVDEIYSYRGMRQPLELPNCGSVFKNPENSVKGAGRLIEAANLKGLTVGGAEVSRKHANFILNTGTATASDVYEVIHRVREGVFANAGVQLENEVILLGKF